MNYYLITRIEDIADWASKESGASKVDKTFKKYHKRNTAIYIAIQYGYVPNKERKFEFA
ncbi:hypothetical protein [Photobacterium phosphoreum]|uniref:hypothetical protein n=1 Tax=Photobacterium phosphoreum TaxID=659 RepID=UPI0024B6B5E7|nr:hypothetical protein [Photobacterium phosphoreum]